MPLRQSTLDFRRFAAVEKTQTEEHDLSTEVTDTITVAGPDSNTQLPTPSESATDVSSQSSQPLTSTKMPESRSKRVSVASKRRISSGKTLNDAEHGQQDNSRSVSGETLVQVESEVVPLPKAKDVDAVEDAPKFDEDEKSSVIVVQEDSEDEKEREGKRAAKIAKMQENAKKWEERKEAAAKNATRRSGRSVLDKASEILDNIKETVLGKRPRAAGEAAAKTGASGAALDKRPRLDADEMNYGKVANPAKIAASRTKKWLKCGLYAGQPRMFDARLTENKNKRKSKASAETQTKENAVIPLPMFAGERLLQYGRDFKLPFDVFSPLPAGQPKPDEWKKVNRNVFVGDAAAEWRTNKYVEHSTCLCNRSTGCDQDCMNRYMYYECDDRNCNIGQQHCSNRAFEQLNSRAKIGGKYNVGVEVIKTVDRGYGVRVNRSFDPNQIIVEYTGEIITQEECESRMRSLYKDNENMIIDATRGSIARFVNHSCEPNCRMEKWTVGGKPRMALFAGDQGVMTGDELTYDYNFDPYSQKNVQECRCGAQNCRGVLGPKPKPETKRSSPEEEAGKKKSGKLAGAKRKVAEVLEESTSRLNKKPKIDNASQGKTPTLKPPQKGKQSQKRAVLVKKASSRKVSMPKPTIKLRRSHSKLKKILNDAKCKAGSLKSRRVLSSSSATEALLPKKAPVARSSSLKEKAKAVTKSIRRSNTISAAG